MIETCKAAVEYMQLLDLDVLPSVAGTIKWYNSSDKTFFGIVVRTAEGSLENYSIRDVVLIQSQKYDGTLNVYDASLEWMVVQIKIVRKFYLFQRIDVDR